MAKTGRTSGLMTRKFSDKLVVRDLSDTGDNAFDMRPDAGALANIAHQLGLQGLRKLRFAGTLKPLGRNDWQLKAKLGATAIQTCVITAEPVTTRIDTDVTRQYLHALKDAPSNAEHPGETEFDGSDEEEPLESEIDLAAVAIETLALALPDYPRAEGAELGEAVFTAPGTAPMTDQETKPFASLAALKDKLQD
jgi:uncharacterized metal-binding protein YceD (DUF177 family)